MVFGAVQCRPATIKDILKSACVHETFTSRVWQLNTNHLIRTRGFRIKSRFANANF